MQTSTVIPSNTTDGSLHRALRNATSEAHRQLDHSLTGAFDDIAGYVAFLRGSYGALRTIEAELIAIGVLTKPAGESRAERIEADLAELGAIPPRMEVPASIAPGIAPGARASAFGAAYVIEGSALGGVVLAKRVRETLGLHDATRYLAVHGDQTMARWREFLQRLDDWGRAASADEQARALASARSTFDHYAACFVREGLGIGDDLGRGART